MKKIALEPETKIGFLTLKHEIKVKGAKLSWLCLCDCGTECTRQHTYLANTYKKQDRQPSCGCRQHDALKGDKNSGWTGCGDLSGQYYKSIQCRAKQKKKSKNRENGIEFNVSIEFLWNLFLSQNSVCALSGIPITLSQSKRRKRAEQTASLDRIDCSKGYVEDNVQWVHKDINKMRNTMPIEDFVKTCKIVANYNIP